MVGERRLIGGVPPKSNALSRPSGGRRCHVHLGSDVNDHQIVA
jgi:hypothetical protein